MDNHVIVVIFRFRGGSVVGSEVFFAGEVSLLENSALLLGGGTRGLCRGRVYAQGVGSIVAQVGARGSTVSTRTLWAGDNGRLVEGPLLQLRSHSNVDHDCGEGGMAIAVAWLVQWVIYRTERQPGRVETKACRCYAPMVGDVCVAWEHQASRR